MSQLKVIYFVLFSSLMSVCNAAGVDIEVIRSNYGKAVSDKTICQNMITELISHNESAVRLAYLGGFQTVWANHTMNPISKLSTFNTGKKNIKDAVKRDPFNVEIRFIRLSIQANCPSFLGYNENIDEDFKFIQSHNINSSSIILKKMIEDLIQKQKNDL